jgi:hypothetical protein
MEKIKEIIDMFFAQKQLYERATGSFVLPAATGREKMVFLNNKEER